MPQRRHTFRRNWRRHIPQHCLREIARCEKEIAAMLEQAPTQPAWLTTLGIEDWEAEKRLLLSGSALAGSSDMRSPDQEAC